MPVVHRSHAPVRKSPAVKISGRQPADKCYPASRAHYWAGFPVLAVELSRGGAGKWKATDPYTGRALTMPAPDGALSVPDQLRALADQMDAAGFMAAQVQTQAPTPDSPHGFAAPGRRSGAMGCTECGGSRGAPGHVEHRRAELRNGRP